METSFCGLIGMPATVKLHIYDKLSFSDPQTSFLKGEGQDENVLPSCRVSPCLQPLVHAVTGIDGLGALQCCLLKALKEWKCREAHLGVQGRMGHPG